MYPKPPLTVSMLFIISARGDRMKQAQVDADELIAAYRLEQQDAFDKKANADGKSINRSGHYLTPLMNNIQRIL